MTHTLVRSRELDFISLILLSATVEPFANSLDSDDTPSNSASHSDPSCLTLKATFLPNVERIFEVLKLKQTMVAHARIFVQANG